MREILDFMNETPNKISSFFRGLTAIFLFMIIVNLYGSVL